MTPEEAAGKEELHFTIGGQEYVTGPVTLGVQMKARKLAKLLIPEDSDLQDQADAAQALLIGLLLDGRKLFPADLVLPSDAEARVTKQIWLDRIEWVADQMSLSDLEAANRTIDESMPPGIKAQVAKAQEIGELAYQAERTRLERSVTGAGETTSPLVPPAVSPAPLSSVMTAESGNTSSTGWVPDTDGPAQSES